MTDAPAASPAQPGRDCPLCARLVDFRLANRAKFPSWHNAPVPSFGPMEASLAIVGLGPGLRGANASGRPFTGDWAGDLLYATLLGLGLARGTYLERPDDGLELVDCRITNAVRCVPPENRPTPHEIATCRDFLVMTLKEMSNLRAIVTLGRVAHETVIAAQNAKRSVYPFSHGSAYPMGAATLFASYHCSRYNTSTRVLTPKMFHDVFAQVRAHLDATA